MTVEAPIHARQLSLILAAATVAILFAGAPRAADPADRNWPCQQRKVASISAGQVWSGPPLEAIGNGWRDDPAVAELARRIAERRTGLDEAKTLIADFTAGGGPDKDRRLAALAAGMLSIINSDRASIIAGIERYSKRQRDLAMKIERQTVEIQAIPADGTESERSRRADLQEMQNWDTRIFQEREKSLTYVCELPVQLERRAFALGREIASHLAQ